MKALVLGGAGYIGSHTCKALAAANHEVIVYDNLSTGHLSAARWGPFVQGDIRDSDRISSVIRQHRPDLVIHFAALAYVGESMRHPDTYYDVNVSGTLSLLKAMASNGLNRLVFSSSCATYGIPSQMPISEDALQEPVNPYGRTKLIAEQMFADFALASDLHWVALRYFNAAGADPEGEIGEDHDPETHAMPLAIRAALSTGPAFQVFGRDFDTSDGTAIRDYVHVCDLAAAHVAAAEYLHAGGDSVALNLGTGRGTSVLELIQAVRKVTGRPVPHRFAPARPGDPPCLFADGSKARKVLGWKPRFELDDMIAHAANWFAESSKDPNKVA